MPLSSLKDPVELAQASAALEVAWNEVRLTLSDPFDERERTRLAYIVASLVTVAEIPDDLTRLAIERFRKAARYQPAWSREEAGTGETNVR